MAPTTPDKLVLVLLLWPRFGRNETVRSVINHELAVMLAGMLDQSVGKIVEAGLRWTTSSNLRIHTLVALGFNQVGAVLHALFDERNHLGSCLVVIRLGIISETSLLAF